MPEKKTLKDEMLGELKKTINKNPDYDYIHRDMKSRKVLEELKWKSKTKSEDDMLLMLRAYQRMIRIMPKAAQNMTLDMLEQGFHSALQIAAMSRKEFMEKTKTVFKDDRKLAESVYQNALYKRGQLVIQYMNIKQNSEPHVRAARV